MTATQLTFRRSASVFTCSLLLGAAGLFAACGNEAPTPWESARAQVARVRPTPEPERVASPQGVRARPVCAAAPRARAIRSVVVRWRVVAASQRLQGSFVRSNAQRAAAQGVWRVQGARSAYRARAVHRAPAAA